MGVLICAHLLISGRVQGVLFRQSARAKALELGLTGWAHNLLDGKVEIVCEGETEKVEQFIEWCKKGPSLAKVENVEVQYHGYEDEWKDFEVREFGF
ncbi:MAG: acylphosphatase [bacterium]|nr:acylphosphatase [bacterium]